MGYSREKIKAKQVKTCSSCGMGNLAWSKTAEGWRLFPGRFVCGEWEADTSQPQHNCRQKNGGQRPRVEVDKGSLTALAFRCGVTVYISEVDLMKVGYPVCGACQDYFALKGVEGDPTPGPKVEEVAA